MKTVQSLFENYSKEAFRLERLPIYKVDGERENYEKHLADGSVIQDQDLKEFIASTADKIKSGCRHIRVRVLPEPLNDYVKFETKVGYIAQSKIGVEIVVMSPMALSHIEAELDFKFEYDFWLFDCSDLVVMKYTGSGEFVDAFVSQDHGFIEKAIAFRKTAVSNCLPFSYLLDQI